ncbi:MAG: TetR family transcriptional regulator [Bacteroidetes bacterium MedPE-SWsnd-G2]|nr:MAG: TetR family transcriptional regulator [Bacteroidetes bacterium MedPE-SWsnd-G2]
MARQKAYDEAEVIEKAMHLFWRVGYENTSTRMLEKEMGINQFSIYSSFKNKQGVFLASLNCYKSKMNAMFSKLKIGTEGIEDIKTFFHESIEVLSGDDFSKGCLITNTYFEFSERDEKEIKESVSQFMEDLKNVFIEKLKLDSSKDEDTIQKQANYLLVAKHGLAAASRVNSKEEINDYIELVFASISM